MKTKIFGLAVAFCFLAATACFADDVNEGTWKLNESKSKIHAKMGKNTKVEYEMSGNDVVTCTVDGMDEHGKATHNEWIGRFDGKYYPLKGDPEADARAYKKIDDHTMNFYQLKNRKVSLRGKIVVAADGKSRTVTVTAWDKKGRKVKQTTVYDKD